LHWILPADRTRKALGFTPRERLAVSYARLISATPLLFPDEFIAELTSAFTEREIVILAGLAVEINRNGRLFEALGAQPPGS
jgi:hypothetical protein